MLSFLASEILFIDSLKFTEKILYTHWEKNKPNNIEMYKEEEKE